MGLSTGAGAETGYVGATTFAPRAEGGYNIRLTGGGAEELYRFLASPKGEDVTCTRTPGDFGDRYDCEFSVDGDGYVGQAQVVDEYGDRRIGGWTSTWVHRVPKNVVKVKFASDLARELQATVLPLGEKRIESRNDLRCGRYLSRHGKIGGLLGLAPRCYVGFDPAGRALPADELP